MWQLDIYLQRSARCPQHTASQWSLAYRFQSRNSIFLRSGSMSSSKHTERCWTKSSGRYYSYSPLHIIPAPGAGISTFSFQMATSGIGNRFWQNGFQIPQSIATYVITSGVSNCGGSVETSNFEIMCILTSNAPGRITTYIEHWAMPTPRQLMPNCPRSMFSKDSMCFEIFPALWATCLTLTSSIQFGLACLTTSRSGYPTSWRRTNSSTSTMQSSDLCLLTMTSHQKISHMRKFLNEMGRRWSKWACTCREL